MTDMSTAAVDGLGFLPSPPSKGNNGACQLLEGQVFAYASHSAISIVDVRPNAFKSEVSNIHDLVWLPCILLDRVSLIV
jgi:hypothetical protein